MLHDRPVNARTAFPVVIKAGPKDTYAFVFSPSDIARAIVRALRAEGLDQSPQTAALLAKRLAGLFGGRARHAARLIHRVSQRCRRLRQPVISFGDHGQVGLLDCSRPLREQAVEVFPQV